MLRSWSAPKPKIRPITGLLTSKRSLNIGIVVGELKHLGVSVFHYIEVHACLFLSHDLCREQTRIRSLKLVVLTQIKLVHP